VGTSFYTIFLAVALEEEEVTAVSLFVLETILVSMAAASPVTSIVWSASLAITQGKWVWCSKQ
jgi:hypothetical protein